MKTPASLPGAAGSAPVCCALTADECGFRDCGAPATHRSQSGKPYCTEHAQARLDLGSKCYLIQRDRPDPRGLRLILRVVRHQLSPGTMEAILRERSRRVWLFAKEIAEYCFKGVVGVPIMLAGVLWLLISIPYELIRHVFWAFAKPDAARNAFRILDGLPPNAKRERPADGGER